MDTEPDLESPDQLLVRCGSANRRELIRNHATSERRTVGRETARFAVSKPASRASYL